MSRFARFVLAFVSLAVPALQGQWTQVKSPHFTVITDAGEKRGREVALRFEQVHDSFGVILQKMKVNSPIPVTIIALRNNKELSPYCPLYNGKPIQLAGFFQQGQDRDYIVVDLSSEGGWHVVYHEYAHLLLHTNLPPVPTWFDEGWAEYFASLRVEKKDLYFGEMSDAQAYVLNQNRWMKSAALFSVGPKSAEYNESGDHRSVFYAESWLVVHYLMDKRKMAEASKFLDDVEDRHVPVPTAFQAAFGMSTDKFDQELQNYYHSSNQMRYYRQPAPAGLGEGAYSAKPLPITDAQAALADLHFHEMDYRERAIGEFEAILQQDPNNAMANRGIAHALAMHGKMDEAMEHIQKAVQTDPDDAPSHYLYAYLLSQHLGYMSEDEAAKPDSKVQVMKNEAKKAIAINPELADAYEVLGRAQMMSGEDKDALASLNKAIMLNPNNDGYRMNLANFYRKNHDREAAKKVLATVANNPNSPMAEAARNEIENLEHPLEQESTGVVMYRPSKESSEAAPVVVNTPVRYAKGKLLSVDCSTEPGAKFLVDVGGKQWTFSAADRNHLVLLGEDSLSCDWHDRKVAINYREHGEAAGDIVSLELQ